MPSFGRSFFDPACRKVLLCVFLLAAPFAVPCTRVVYLGPDNNVITARSMDWKVDVGTNLWIFPEGAHRTRPRRVMLWFLFLGNSRERVEINSQVSGFHEVR